MSAPASAAVAPPNARLLGTFLGVFTPSILTILGVVLFLRTGWVVGNVGLAGALAIVVLAHLITFATAFSVSAIATNMHVGAGGAYYIVSRSLGLEVGGAVGVPLFLAQTFSITLYSFGLAESLQLFWPEVPLRPVAAATVVVVSLVAGRSTELALKLQIPIMVAIGVSLLSLFGGVAQRAGESVLLWRGVDHGEPFWTVFAVFFPAVTGLMAGVSLSGDLRDPQRSITVGTLSAVGVGFVVYLAVPIALAFASEPSLLVADNLIWFQLAAIPVLVFPGLFGAIVSSAVGSLLGAPRTLQALMDDKVLPRLAIPGLGQRFNAQIPHLLATAVALAAVGLGDLNAVAPVLTMFFLTTYGVVNLVAGLEQLSGAPSYRPALRVPWWVSLLGAVGCVWVMWLINPVAALVAGAVEVGIYVALRRRALAASWGDLRYGALISLTRLALLHLRRLPVDPRNWRPHILLFAGDPRKRLDLLRFAAWLNQKRGILTVSRLMIGELEELAPRIPAELQSIQRVLDERSFLAFPEVEVASDFEAGVLETCQANGIAGLTSNTIMFGWTEKPERLASLLRISRRASLLGKSTVVCRVGSRSWAERPTRIDVWWGGLEQNGDMLLLFAYLLTANPEWSSARITVKTIATSDLPADQIEGTLADLLARSRIKAGTRVLPALADGRTVRDEIASESADADLVLLGLPTAPPGEEEAFAARLHELVADLPSAILVRAAGPFAGQLLESAASGSRAGSR